MCLRFRTWARSASKPLNVNYTLRFVMLTLHLTGIYDAHGESEDRRWAC